MKITQDEPRDYDPGTQEITKSRSKTIAQKIEELKPQLAKALPKHVTTERLIRVALTAIRNEPRLEAADQLSLMGAIMVAAQLGLEPNTPLGHAYLIPYGRQVQFQVGYKGLLDLAHRSGQYRQITAHAVDEADQFSYQYGLFSDLSHVPADTPTGRTVKYYAVYHLTNGGHDFKVWSRERVQAHAEKYSKATGKGPWVTDFDAMAQKTVLIDLLKTAPKSIEIAQATNTDNRSPKFSPRSEAIDLGDGTLISAHPDIDAA